MSNSFPTAEQQKAINVSGNVVVSAAAGSGKTAVLVERVFRLLSDPVSPIPANRLLIVTFTNAAAAEMRSRIEKRLLEACKDFPDNKYLLRQKYLLASAKICTIDSFCIDLVRENFERAGVSPDFKIDGGEAVDAIGEQVMKDLFLEHMEKDDPAFRQLLDLTMSEFDEQNCKDCIAALFRYSCQMPFPNVFLDSVAAPFFSSFTEEHPWYRYAMEEARSAVNSNINEIISAGDLIGEAERGGGYLPVLHELSETNAALGDAVSCGIWDDVRLIVQNFVKPRIPGIKGVNEIPDLQAIKQMLNELIDSFERLKKLFLYSVSEIEDQKSEFFEPITLLISLTKEYSERLFAEQCRQNLFTFYNTEQLALSMLCTCDGETITVRDDASDFFDRFDEILVDEYQDTNDLQNRLFGILSDHERKLFVVGDVKQSIYGFRGANPIHFLNKKKRSVNSDEAEEDDAKKVILSKNFRSRAEICGFINFVFGHLMTEQTGKIEYGTEEKLNVGAEFPQTGHPCVELHVVNGIKEAVGEGETNFTAEARYIASYINSVMTFGPCIRNKETMTLRPARYSDFAVLIRSANAKEPILAAELRKFGIPVSFSKTEYLETPEISTVLSLLKVIDNPKSDIELLTVMMSPIFGFTVDEMAQIRVKDRKGSLISAVTAAAKDNAHAKCFLDTLAAYRREAVLTELPRFISYLLSVTDYLNIVSAMEDGARRRGNLLLLPVHASKYCENFFGGINGFISYLKNQEKNLHSAKSSGGEDTIRVMSIHRSKGLQFPICILADLNHRFNKEDSTKSFLFTEEIGIGFKYFDEKDHKRRSMLSHILNSDFSRRKTAEEELRLLYVAMTRAEDRLVMISSNDKLEEKLKKLSAALLAAEYRISARVYSGINSLNDAVLLTALLHPDGSILRKLGGIPLIPSDTDSNLHIFVSDGGEIADAKSDEISEAVNETDSEKVQTIISNLNYRYPYDELRRVEAKCSVSALANKAESTAFSFTGRPAFMTKDGLTGAERGTAMHKVMQFIRMDTAPDLDAEMERLVEWQYLSEEEAGVINRKALLSFFESELFGRVLHSDDVRREMRFLTEIPAGRAEPTLSEKLADVPIIVQGAVDLCFVEDGAVVIVDFKSDRVENEKQLTDSYAEQLNIYARACEKIFAMPVKERIIYSFALQKQIVLP